MRFLFGTILDPMKRFSTQLALKTLSDGSQAIQLTLPKRGFLLESLEITPQEGEDNASFCLKCKVSPLPGLRRKNPLTLDVPIHLGMLDGMSVRVQVCICDDDRIIYDRVFASESRVVKSRGLQLPPNTGRREFHLRPVRNRSAESNVKEGVGRTSYKHRDAYD